MASGILIDAASHELCFLFLMNKDIRNFIYVITVMTLTACNGIMDGLYDEDTSQRGGATVDDIEMVSGTLTIDASNWKNWYYIDLHALHDSIVNGAEQDLSFPPYPIPTTLTGEWDGASAVCTYWYDVFGEGLQNHELRSSTPADTQEEPEQWDLALHRDNVRTNGGAVFMTQSADINDLGDAWRSDAATWQEDEWNEIDVWMDQSQMFTGVIGNQRIKINTLLSSWLTLQIPPIPPSFTYNGNAFVIRLKDGTYAAIRLADYRKQGTNCIMTIEYRYPLQ